MYSKIGLIGLVPDDVLATYTDSSIHIFSSVLERLARELNITNYESETLIPLIKDTKRVISTIDKWPRGSSKPLLAIILVILQYHIRSSRRPKVIKQLTDMKREYQDLYTYINNTDQILASESSEDIPSFDELKSNGTKYLESSTNPIDHLIFAVYTSMPPLRPNELINRIRDGKLIISRHKTVRSYGEKVIELPKAVLELLDVDGQFLIPERMQQTIGRRIRSIFGYPSSIIRKAYINHHKSDSLQERHKSSMNMGHSLTTATLHYLRDRNFYPKSPSHKEL